MTQGFDNTPEDLALNQQGRLSPRQAQRSRASTVDFAAQNRKITAAALLGLGGLIVGGNLAAAANHGQPLALLGLVPLAAVGGLVWRMASRPQPGPGDALRATVAADLASGQVAQVPGVLHWDGQSYVARASSGPPVVMPELRVAAVNAPPGPYTLFVLPGSRLLVGVQPAGSPDRQEWQRALCDGLGFTAEDLALNRQGQPSPAQQERYRKLVRGSKLFNKDADPGPLPVERAEVTAVVKVKDISTDDDRASLVPALEVGKLLLPLAGRGGLAVIPGQRYRVYYSSLYDGWLLSLEPA